MIAVGGYLSRRRFWQQHVPHSSTQSVAELTLYNSVLLNLCSYLLVLYSYLSVSAQFQLVSVVRIGMSGDKDTPGHRPPLSDEDVTRVATAVADIIGPRLRTPATTGTSESASSSGTTGPPPPPISGPLVQGKPGHK